MGRRKARSKPLFSHYIEWIVKYLYSVAKALLFQQLNAIFELFDPQNLLLDTKIITLAALVQKLLSFVYFGSHICSYLEYFKFLKGENFTLT